MQQLLRTTCILAALAAGSVAAQGILEAASTGDTATLEELLTSSTVDSKTLNRPLYIAAQRGHTSAVELLLDHGADPNTAYLYGAAFHSAARGDHIEVVAMLLDHGADPSAKAGEFENTALHEVASSGALDAARLLLEAGADVNARNNEDQPPLHLALRRNKTELATLLRATGAASRNVSMPTPEALEAAAADPDAGWLAARFCRGCHEFEVGDTSTATEPGPTLRGVFERPKASVPEFSYSEAMLSVGGKWTLEEMNQFIGDVYGTVPGTKMYNVDPNITEAERTALLALLATLGTE